MFIFCDIWYNICLYIMCHIIYNMCEYMFILCIHSHVHRHPYANNFLKKNELWLPSTATISCDLVTFPSFLCFLVSCEMEGNCIHFQHCWLGVNTCRAQRMLTSGNRKCSCWNLMVIPSRKHHVWLLPDLRRSVKTRQGDKCSQDTARS